MKRNMLCIMVVLSMIILPGLNTSVSACTEAILPINWLGVDMTTLTVKMCSSAFSNAVEPQETVYAWNGITNNVRVTSYVKADASASYNADILFFEYNYTGSTLGKTVFYAKNATGVYYQITDNLSNNTGIVQTRINLDTDLLGSKSHYLNKTIIHELGHAFCLNHPTEYGCNAVCVMQQIASGYHSLEVEPHDIYNLVAKWGYA